MILRFCKGGIIPALVDSFWASFAHFSITILLGVIPSCLYCFVDNLLHSFTTYKTLTNYSQAHNKLFYQLQIHPSNGLSTPIL
jgi:hypothetical protein